MAFVFALLGLILLLMFLSLGTVWGWNLAHDELSQRSRQVSQQEAKLQAEWDALYAAQQLNASFMEARRLMAEEAIRQSRRSGGL